MKSVVRMLLSTISVLTNWETKPPNRSEKAEEIQVIAKATNTSGSEMTILWKIAGTTMVFKMGHGDYDASEQILDESSARPRTKSLAVSKSNNLKCNALTATPHPHPGYIPNAKI